MISEAERKLDDEQSGLLDEMNRGRRAAAILENPLFKDAVRAVRDGAVSQFENSAEDDDRTRTLARLKVGVLQDVVGRLTRHMHSGQAAETRLSGLRDAVSRLKDRMRRPTA